MNTRLRENNYLSNWTPLDMPYFPPLPFLDITLDRTHRCHFPTQNHLNRQITNETNKNQPKSIKDVTIVVHPKCISM